MLYNLLLLLPINKWVNKKKREIKKEKKNINSGDNHQCGDNHQYGDNHQCGVDHRWWRNSNSLILIY
jgi:hypothetical protein